MLNDFEDGYIHYNRMIGFNKGQPLSNAGSFQKISVNLLNSMVNKIDKEDVMEKQSIYIDDYEDFNMERIVKAINKQTKVKTI